MQNEWQGIDSGQSAANVRGDDLRALNKAVGIRGVSPQTVLPVPQPEHDEAAKAFLSKKTPALPLPQQPGVTAPPCV